MSSEPFVIVDRERRLESIVNDLTQRVSNIESSGGNRMDLYEKIISMSNLGVTTYG